MNRHVRPMPRMERLAEEFVGTAKRSKALPPRRKRMSRPARLQAGRHWLKNFSGKRVVSSYARWFAVDLVCAATELQMLRVRLSAEYLQGLRRTVAARLTQGNTTRRGTEGIDLDPTFDHEFAFIAGHTEGGAPFGVRWDEVRDADDEPLGDAEAVDQTEVGGSRRRRPTG